MGGGTPSRNQHSSGRTRTSGNPACTGYPLAANRKSGKSASDAPPKASTQRKPVRSRHQAWSSASGDTNPRSQFSTSFGPTNASKKIP